MSATTFLGPQDFLATRPFTHPQLIAKDRANLRYMLAQLCLLLEYPYLPDGNPHIVLFRGSGMDAWFHRLVLARNDDAWAAMPLTVVGFFGRRREDANLELAREFDRLLIAEFPEYPGLCAYSTMALDGGNYGNLVVFSDGEARHQWSTSRAHSQAASTLSPNYYLTVTIYHGELQRGLMETGALRLTKAKYFDYQCQPRWEAVREIG